MKSRTLASESPGTKQIGIWIRVSTEDQERGDSPQHHEKRACFYAESKDWRVREVYHLEATSGKSVMAHPETQRMLKDVGSGHITGLIFSKLARLARNTRELLEFAEIFKEHEADLISLQESIDTSSPAGRLFYTMIAAMAQWEREEISDRVAASVPVRAKLGKPLGGQAPYGYQWKDRILLPDPKEAPVRKLIYELFLEHQRKKRVARLLNEAGHRTRNGSQFSDTTVERLLRDPTAMGLRRANYTKSLGEKKHWVMKPEDEWIFTKIEPIVEEEIWKRCNGILDEQQRKGKRLGRTTVQLFAGLAFCICGNKMYVPSNTPKYICHKCRNKIPTVDLDGVFHEQLKSFYFSPSEVVSLIEQSDHIIKEKQELLEVLEREQQKLGQEMDKVYRLYIDDKLSPEGFGKRNRPLEERYKQLENQIPQLQGEVDFLKIQYLSRDQVLTEAKDFYSRWPDFTFEEKRKIVETLTEKIVIGKDDVTINLCYLPNYSEMIATKQRNVRDSSPRPA